jgi:hypothetical protein
MTHLLRSSSQLVNPMNRQRFMGFGTGAGGGGIPAPLMSWEADAGVTSASIGGAVSSWVSGSYDLTQGTAGNRPTHVAAFTTGHGVSCDGSSDFLSISNPLTGATGSIAIVFRTGTIGTRQVTDTGAANEWFEIGVTAAGLIYLERNAAGTVSRIVGSTVLTSSTSYQLFAAYDGTDYYLTLNGTEENPLVVESIGTRGWFSTVTSGDTLSVGAALPSGSGARFFTGTLGVIRIWDTDITH